MDGRGLVVLPTPYRFIIFRHSTSGSSAPPAAPFVRPLVGMVELVDFNVFETANAGFAQAMYEEFLRDPAAVGPEWRRLFESGVVGERPDGNGVSASKPAGEPRPAVAAALAPAAPAPSAALPAGSSAIKGPAAKLVANMNESLTVPTATTFRVLPVGVLEDRRRAFNAALQAAGKSGKVSFTHLIAFALVQATKQHPVMGHTLAVHDGTSYRVAPEGIALGLAVDVQRKDGSRGLVVPVIKRADMMDFATFHAAYEALVDKARSNRLMPDDFAGATMSLTNPGGLGTVASVPRLMAGQGSIIAVGAIGYPAEFSAVPEERLRDFGVSKVMTVTSTYDHRVIQGAESGAFLATMDRAAPGRPGVLRPHRREPRPGRGGLPDLAAGPDGAAGAGARRTGRARDAVPRGRGDGAGEGLPHARAPGGASRPARHAADR